ncbi:MAG TPA: amino acid adenylation domain-containing protein [Thermoanaerobaculia bacterium]|nr:amino acid adenylation domain-containing protein [Thermoanaerobaculia bacterium]
MFQRDTIPSLFERQVERTPDRVAVACEGVELTYAALQARANGVTRHLLDSGVRAEEPVAVVMPRCAEAIAALLGVMRAGAAFVPLDPDAPAARREQMMRELGVRFVIAAADDSVATVDTPAVEPNQLAYIIHTSGSTGLPKGVMVEHRSVVNLWQALNEAVYRELRDEPLRVSVNGPLTFDTSVKQWIQLFSGRTLEIVPQDVRFEGPRMLAFLAGRRVDVLDCTPSQLRLLLEAGLADATEGVPRIALIGGEAIDAREWDALRRSKRTRFFNVYGPTECTVDATACAVDEHDAPTLGRPLPNVSVHLIDGEICIGGAGVARGYFGQPELTARKFVENGHGRIYRTGDLGLLHEDGTIEYRGRNDDQVKIRGIRIEPGEVAAALQQVDGVAAAVVVAREDEPGDKRLVAYYTGTIAASALRAAAIERLPDALVPSAFVALETIPLNAHGKVDRKALPKPEYGRAGGTYAAPRDAVEEAIAAAWSDVLHVARPGIDDNFFALGGHSLLATRVAARIQESFGVRLPLRTLFARPTIAGVASELRALIAGGTAVAPAIVHRGGETVRASLAQERLLFLSELTPDDRAYDVIKRYDIDGPLDGDALTRALNFVIARHDSLRTRFEHRAGQWLQVVAPKLEIPLLLSADATLPPFDLRRGPLTRAKLVRVGNDRHSLFVAFHHTIFDGWSAEIFQRELVEAYDAFATGRAPRLEELPLQFGDFAEAQRNALEGDALPPLLTYWKAQLDGVTVLNLPVDRVRPANPTSAGDRRASTVAARTLDALRRIAEEEQATLFMVLLAAYDVLLHRHSGQRDIAVGTPVANRDSAASERAIGFFANTLVLRADLTGDPTFRELVARVREVCLGAYAHQELPFEKLVAELNPDRALSRNPLFQTMFVYQNEAAAPVRAGGATFTAGTPGNGTTKFDLMFSAVPSPDGLHCAFDFSTELFHSATIERMLGHLGTLLEAAAADPDCRISALPLLTPAERRQLEAWNHTELAYSESDDEPLVHELFEEEVARMPNAPALWFRGETMSYRELDARTNQLARFLRSRGARPGAIVALSLERSFEMAMAIVATLKSGAAYLPLAPDYPVERLRYTLAEAQPVIVLTQERFVESVAAGGVPTLALDAEWPRVAQESTARIASRATPGDLAYVIYTSGSTGRPKGVMNTHRGIINRLLWFQHAYHAIGYGDAVMQKTPYGFDISVWELLWPLITGARLVIAEPGGHQDAPYLIDLIRRERVTVAHFVPSMLQIFLDEKEAKTCTSLRHVICSGEALPLELARRFAAALPAELHNLYGPTEAAVEVTYWPCSMESGAASVPIGFPVANVQIRILDERLQPVPAGVPGELFIGGVAVARGYLARPDLTAEKFIADPFSSEPGARMYRSGDLARWLPNGAVEYLGRLDHQVKIRGFRIELGEIEAVLLQMPSVRDAVVVAHEPAPGDKRLAAYVVARDGYTIDVDELRAGLEERLPEYMVPAAFTILEALPLNTNGKCDRKALPAPDYGTHKVAVHVAPRNAIEQAVAEIWCEALGVPGVGSYDDFFARGGHSILAMKVVARLRETFGVELKLHTFFSAPTVAGLAEAIVAARGSSVPTAPKITPRGADELELPLSFAQERLWFLDQLESGPFYNISRAYALRGPLDVEALQRALSRIVERHEILRTRYAGTSRGAVQFVEAPRPVVLQPVDLRGCADAAAEVRRLRHEDWATPFDLGNGPIIRFQLLRLADDEHKLLVGFHHIVFDGWSGDVFLHELGVLYGAFVQGASDPLPELPLQYADFALWQRRTFRGETAATLTSYWKQRLARASGRLELPTDHSRAQFRGFNAARETIALDAAELAAIRKLSAAAGTTLFMTLAGTFQLLLSRYSGQTDVTVGTPIAGRMQRELEGLIGFFANTLVLHGDVAGNPTFRELLERTREACVGAYAHQDMPFEKLVEEINPVRDLTRNPLFQTMFLLETGIPAPVAAGGLEIEQEPAQNATAKFDLTLITTTAGDGLTCAIEYSTGLFEGSTIRRMLEHYRTLLRGAAANPDERVLELPMVDASERRMASSRAFSDTHDATIAELFEQQAARTPKRIAVSCGDESITYAELSARANGVARELLRLGASAEEPVAACFERSIDAIVALTGILKAGCTFVPLDPEAPASRNAHVVEDIAARIVLTHAAARARVPAAQHVIDLAEIAATNAAPGVRHGEHPLAYILFTSASTGTPKGVMIEQQSVVNLWRALDEAVYRDVRGQHLRVTLNGPLTFDTSVKQWIQLLSGHTLDVVPAGIRFDGARLADFLREREIDVLDCTPSQLRLLLDAGFAGREEGVPRIALVGGEAIDRLLWQSLRRATRTRFFNVYGPTECTVDTTAAEIGAYGEPTIGKPIANVDVFITGPHGELQPDGIAGEICIAGAGVGRGYFGDPELTARAFVRNDFGEGRMYRTGDLGRYRADGTIEYLGRNDEQIQIRGVRVEPREIEAVLERLPAVRQAVVVAREDRAHELRLVAYVVTRAAVSADDLQAACEHALPETMVPAAFVFLEAIPLNAHGKVNRRELPEPRYSRTAAVKFVAPRDVIEEAVAAVWCDVLRVERIGIHDNFFLLGGHSLLATRIVTQLRESFAVDLPLRTLFTEPTVAGVTGAMLEIKRQPEQTRKIANALLTVRRMSPDGLRAALDQHRTMRGDA